jgi:hypothetical protein
LSQLTVFQIAERASSDEKKLQSQTSSLLPRMAPALERNDSLFGGFSFVASDWTGGSSETTTEDVSFTDDDETQEFAWPFTVGMLPAPVVVSILLYLNLEDVAKASRVCRTWNQFIWTNLRRMDLSNVAPNTFRKHWKRSIAASLKRPFHLTELHLNRETSDDDLIAIPSIQSLEMLDFSGCSNLSAKGLRTLTGSRFKGIRLGRSKSPPSTFELKFPSLRSLNLSECPDITDDAFEYLILYRHLGQLDLSHTSVTGSGLSHLTHLKELWRLSLQGLVRLRDAALEHLTEIPNLRVLELDGCSGLTEDGVQRLRLKLQNLEVLTWNQVPREENKAKRKLLKLGLILHLGRPRRTESQLKANDSPLLKKTDKKVPFRHQTAKESPIIESWPNKLEKPFDDFNDSQSTSSSLLHPQNPQKRIKKKRPQNEELDLRHRLLSRGRRRSSSINLTSSKLLLDQKSKSFIPPIGEGTRCIRAKDDIHLLVDTKIDVPSLLADLGRRQQHITTEFTRFSTQAIADRQIETQRCQSLEPPTNSPKPAIPQFIKSKTVLELRPSLVNRRSEELLLNSRDKSLPSKGCLGNKVVTKLSRALSTADGCFIHTKSSDNRPENAPEISLSIQDRKAVFERRPVSTTPPETSLAPVSLPRSRSKPSTSLLMQQRIAAFESK